MKTIEEAASSHEINRDNNSIDSLINKHTIVSFKAGVRFAEEWIDVNDELPEIKYQSVGVLYSDYVLVTVLGYSHPFVAFYIEFRNESGFDLIHKSIQDSLNQKSITHWRPINRK